MFVLSKNIPFSALLLKMYLSASKHTLLLAKFFELNFSKLDVKNALMSVSNPKIKYFFYIFPLFALYLQQQACCCGILLTFDSWQYLSAAQCFIANEPLKMADGDPFIAYPALFPFVLSFFGKNPLPLLPTFWGILYFFNLSLWIYLGQCYLKDKLMHLCFCACLCLSTPLLLVHSFLWSETLFISFLSLLFLYYHFNPKNFVAIDFLVVLIGIVILVAQRNAGVWWGIGILLWLVFLKKHISIFSIFALCLGIVFLLSWGFYLQSLNPTSFKHASILGFIYEASNNVLICSRHLSSWLIPRATPAFVATGLGILLFVFLLFVVLSYQNVIPKFIYLLLFCNGVYLVGLLILRTSALHHSDLERFMAVMQPSFWLVFFYLIAQQLKANPKLKGYFQVYLFYFLMVVSIAYQSGRLIKNTYFLKENQCKTLSATLSPRSVAFYDICQLGKL